MEAVRDYRPSESRPRLTVVTDGAATYSALPHAVLFDARLSRDARLLYAVLQAHWWRTGECQARHETLAAAMSQGESTLSGRQLRRYLDELIAAGYVTETRRGHGQAKVYAPAQVDTEVQSNQTPVSTWASNQTPVSQQPDTGVHFNKTPVSYPYKKTPVKKTSPKEEDNSIPGDSPESELFDYYRSKVQPAARLSAPEKIRARLKKFTLDELKAGIDKFAADAWWMENNAARGAAWFFHSDQRSEQFLNLKPRSTSSTPAKNGSTGGFKHWESPSQKAFIAAHPKWSDPVYDKPIADLPDDE